MFTGLVEGVGIIGRVVMTDAGREFRISCPWSDLAAGESIAVNGACLTVRESGHHWFTAAAVTTTLDRTTLGSWTEEGRVNLERALRLGERLGGHLVQGHVDGVGTVTARRRRESALLLDIKVPADVARLLVPHGSITVDGVSLTVNDLPGRDALQVSIIDYTEQHTTLGDLQAGATVNLEADLIGKYVQAFMGRVAMPGPP